MHVTELFMAVPGPALALAIVAALGPGITRAFPRFSESGLIPKSVQF
jgi:ABC-type dipeptide/oligopeptide/nickel transport system permease subunit